MADQQTPDAQDLEEARRLKDAVARLGASLREESERLHQDPVADLPIAAAPRARSDPRIDVLTEQVATLVELERASAERSALQGDLARARDEETRRLVGRALAVAVTAAVLAIVAVVVAIAALVGP
jgi:hypothetical protein